MEDKQLCRQRGYNAQRWQFGWQVSADIISAEVPILTGHVVAQRLINQKWRTGSLPGWMSAPRQRLSHGKLCRLGTQQEICSRQENRLITWTFNELGPKSGRPIRLWGNNPGGFTEIIHNFTLACFWIHNKGCVTVTDFAKSNFNTLHRSLAKADSRPAFLISPCKFFNFRRYRQYDCADK